MRLPDVAAQRGIAAWTQNRFFTNGASRMDAGTLVVSACLLLGQFQPMPDPGFASGATPAAALGRTGPAPANPAEAPMAGPLVPIRSREAVEHHFTLQQRWFQNTDSLAHGTPLTLLQVLSRPVQGPQRTNAVQAYWQLSQRAAEERVHREAVQRVLAWASRSGPNERAELEAALARLEARRNESQLKLLHAQHELAESIGWTNPEQLPVPVDLPHVGPYRTEFEKIFAGKQSPGSLALLHRVLPVESQLLQVRAEAVVAANDAATSAQDSWLRGEQDLSTALERLSVLTAARQAFLQSVIAYNTNIAEYAMAVAPEQANPATWVSMLIKADSPAAALGNVPASAVEGQSPTPAQSTFRNQVIQQRPLGFGPTGGGVIPATATEPIAVPQQAAPRPRLTPTEEPTLLPAGEAPTSILPRQGAYRVQPRSEAPTSILAGAGKSAESLAPPSPETVQTDAEEPALLQPQAETAEPIPQSSDEASAEPPESRLFPTQGIPNRGEPTPAVRPQAAKPTIQQIRWVARQLTDQAGTQHDQLSAALKRFSGLEELTPPLRARQLAVLLLHEIETAGESEDESLPVVKRRPLSLEECLAQTAEQDRQTAVHRYWQAVRRTAELRLLRDRVEQYQALAHDVLARSDETSHAASMLDLRVKQLSAQGDALQATVFLSLAEWQLTESVDQAAVNYVYRPVTLPHTGGYKVLARSEDAGAVEAMTALDIRVWRGIVDQRATAVVRADTSRSAFHASYQLRGEHLRTTLDAIETQSSDSIEFLAALTSYNDAIADYALQVAPTGISASRLAGTMVMNQ